MISILDYGVGNVRSLHNMIDFIGFDSKITSNEKDLLQSKIIFIPGVGAFDNAITKLKEKNLDSIIKKVAQKEKIYIVGICLGMHVLLNSSAEGNQNGLNLMPNKIISFRDEKINIPIPHMGWNDVSFSQESSLATLSGKYYFCHSFFLKQEENLANIGVSDYSGNFCSFFWSEKIVGIQFHPEKSGKNGIKFLKNLIENIYDN